MSPPSPRERITAWPSSRTAAQSGVIAIAAGYRHTVALKQDGSVVAWGSDFHGQTLVPEAALGGVVKIGAGALARTTFYRLGSAAE